MCVHLCVSVCARPADQQSLQTCNSVCLRLVKCAFAAFLAPQTDKQRIIWAYKILFLDVLFPLGVERIIFVDSDQARVALLH